MPTLPRSIRLDHQLRKNESAAKRTGNHGSYDMIAEYILRAEVERVVSIAIGKSSV